MYRGINLFNQHVSGVRQMVREYKNAYIPRFKVYRPNHLFSPSEVSSKTPVPVLRNIVAPIKKKAIDPRFDRSFGNFDSNSFSKSYGFIGNMQKDEIQKLKETLKSESDPRRRDKIFKTLSRLKSMKQSKDITDRRQQIIRDHRKLEAKLIEEGKKPYYLKKGEIKALEVAAEYEEMKKKVEEGASMDRFIEKKRKKRATKQKKFIPYEY